MTVTASTRPLDGSRGAVRVEDVYDTDIDDLWDACTSPDRLARWIARVSGDLRVGGTVDAVFTSSWTGASRIEACDPPHHLLLVSQPGTDEEGELEAWLTAEGSRTRLVVEERGLPVGQLPFFSAGWQAHLEDLATSLAQDAPVHVTWSPEAPAASWYERWSALTRAHPGPAAG